MLMSRRSPVLHQRPVKLTPGEDRVHALAHMTQAEIAQALNVKLRTVIARQSAVRQKLTDIENLKTVSKKIAEGRGPRTRLAK